MFTGIITDVGRIREIEQRGDTHITIETRYDLAKVDLGASIGCSGPCLTVVAKGPDWFRVTASAETLSKTNMSQWQAGTRINLERALKVGDEIGGHIVSGHIDGMGRIEGLREEGESIRITISVPDELAFFLAPKGSIAMDGVSLTVNEVEDGGAGGTSFGVNIIPHTLENTTYGDLSAGAQVNLEIDMLARYVARLSERT